MGVSGAVRAQPQALSLLSRPHQGQRRAGGTAGAVAGEDFGPGSSRAARSGDGQQQQRRGGCADRSTQQQRFGSNGRSDKQMLEKASSLSGIASEENTRENPIHHLLVPQDMLSAPYPWAEGWGLPSPCGHLRTPGQDPHSRRPGLERQAGLTSTGRETAILSP